MCFTRITPLTRLMKILEQIGQHVQLDKLDKKELEAWLILHDMQDGLENYGSMQAVVNAVLSIIKKGFVTREDTEIIYAAYCMLEKEYPPRKAGGNSGKINKKKKAKSVLLRLRLVA